jgi:hypothetical protein
MLTNSQRHAVTLAAALYGTAWMAVGDPGVVELSGGEKLRALTAQRICNREMAAARHVAGTMMHIDWTNLACGRTGRERTDMMAEIYPSVVNSEAHQSLWYLLILAR